MTPALLADYAWVHPDPAALKAAGYDGALRYLSRDPTKNLTPGELLALHALGLGVGLVWETTATAELGGSAAGAADGAAANTMAAALGWPADRPIFYAADFAAAGGQLATCADYERAAARAGRPAGIYGSAQTVDTLLAEGACAWGWQTSAWSGGIVSAHAHLYQRQSPTRRIAGDALGAWDENVALRPDWGGWYPPLPPPPPGANTAGPGPPISAKGAGMVLLRDPIRGTTVTWNGGSGPASWHPVANPAHMALLEAAGAVVLNDGALFVEVTRP